MASFIHKNLSSNRRSCKDGLGNLENKILMSGKKHSNSEINVTIQRRDKNDRVYIHFLLESASNRLQTIHRPSISTYPILIDSTPKNHQKTTIDKPRQINYKIFKNISY